MPTIIFNKEYNLNRDELLEHLNNQGIAARPFFYPVSSFPMFEEKKENIISYSIFSRGINLPSNFEISERDAEFIFEQINIYCKTIKKQNII
ncbi:hypothetical protein LCGC14_2353590 [marine sediment metagenome]|uniref:DegT/DnrJ/EryC1/StrS aminotransferase family protein n=1 Tax=marine sediment metagenome TaxID=412755 RepID=A0A0F9C8D3_9ZZZZ